MEAEILAIKYVGIALIALIVGIVIHIKIIQMMKSQRRKNKFKRKK